jgi:hypothetical protein
VPAVNCFRVANVTPTMPPSAESKITTTPSTAEEDAAFSVAYF